MASQTLIKKLDREIKMLRQDVAEIKSAIVGVEGDADGKYRDAFVAKVLKRSREKPSYRYRGSTSFLRHVHIGAE